MDKEIIFELSRGTGEGSAEVVYKCTLQLIYDDGLGGDEVRIVPNVIIEGFSKLIQDCAYERISLNPDFATDIISKLNNIDDVVSDKMIYSYGKSPVNEQNWDLTRDILTEKIGSLADSLNLKMNEIG